MKRCIRLTAKSTGTYAMRLRVTAAFLSLVMLGYMVPAELVRAAAEEAAEEAAEPRLIEPYDDPPVSHTAGTGRPEEAEPVGEDAAARTATSKRYRMSDGSVMVKEYGYPVHYADAETGLYEEIDNRLVHLAANQQDAGFYCNMAGYFQVAVAGEIAGSTAHLFVEKDGYGLAVGVGTSGDLTANKSPAQAVTGVIGKTEQTAPAQPEATEEADITAESAAAAAPDADDAPAQPEEGQQAAPALDGLIQTPVATDAAGQATAAEKLHAGLKYESVFAGTDFAYEVTPTGVRESIIVESVRDSYGYTFSLATTGLEAVDHGNTVLFVNDDGETVFRLAAPYMTDAAGAYSEAVTYDLSGTNGQYTLTVTASHEWINAPERVLPVSVQPMFQTWTGNTAEGWTLYHNGTRSAPSGGRVTVSKDADVVVRMPMTTTVPGMMLTRGEVSLYIDGETGGVPAYEIYTAKTAGDFSDVTTVNDLVVSAEPIRTDEATGQYTIPVSSDALADGSLILVLKAAPETADGEVAEIAISSAGYLPVLTLNYRAVQGITDFPTEAFELGDAAAYVNMVSRKSAAVVKGLSVNTDFQPLQVDLYYNQEYDAFLQAAAILQGSNGTENCYGHNFKTTYNQYLRQNADNSIYYHIGADGSVNAYKEDTSRLGYYISEKTNLAVHAIGVGAVLSDSVGNEMEFYNGRLTKIRSENPLLGEIWVSYVSEESDKIDTVSFHRYTGNAGQEFNPLASNEIRYIYSSSGLLSDLKSYYRDENGTMQQMGQKSFSYDNGGNLTAVKNSAGSTRLTLTYALDLPNRPAVGCLSTIKNSTGEGYTFYYSFYDEVDSVRLTQGMTNPKEYRRVEFSSENNTVTAKYVTNRGFAQGTRSVAADNNKDAVSEWYTDAAGRTTGTTDSLWISSDNDPYWPNYSRSVYSFEVRDNTGFADTFSLSPGGIQTSTLTTAETCKSGNRYALLFRLTAAGAAQLTVTAGSQSETVTTSGATDSYVTVPFGHIAAETQIQFTNAGNVAATVRGVSFRTVTQANQYKSLPAVMTAYRIYRDEVIDTETKAVTTYLQNGDTDKIVETDNGSGDLIRTVQYAYTEIRSSRMGRLTSVTETDKDGEQTKKLTISTVRTDTYEKVTEKVNDTVGMYTTSVIYSTGTDTYTRIVSDANDITTEYTYELMQGDFRLTSAECGSETYTYTYNADGAVTGITDALGNMQTVSYTNGGNFSGTTYGTNNTYGIGYNEYLLPANITAGGSTVLSYGYGTRGEMNLVTYANGQQTEFGYYYGLPNRATYKETATDATPEEIVRTYDSAGRVTDVVLKEGTTTMLEYAYGNLDSYTNRTAEVSSPDGAYSAEYEYYIDDEKDRIYAETHTVGTANYATTYTYDDEDRMTSVTIGNYTQTVEYDDNDRIIQTSETIGTWDILNYEYQYVGTDWLHLKREKLNSGCQSQFYNPSAEYDEFGRVITLQNEGQPLRTFEFTYDTIGRLASEQNGLSSVTTYTYNDDGNITRAQKASGADVYGYTNGRLTSFNNGTYYAFSYDAVGNPTTYKNNPLSWTRGRMLKSGTQKGNSFTYKYDAENLRYEKTVNGTKTQYYYNAGQLQAEKRGNDFIYYLYGIDGIAGMIYNGQYYIYEKNILGDVIGIYNSSRAKVATYDYDAWGNVVRKSGTMADVNPIRYRGYYYDTETGFYYLNTRYYDPEIRRFVNADSYELLPELAGVYGQVNLYNYCNNNPVMYTDPTGESAIVFQFFASGITYVSFAIASIFDSDIRADMNEIGWNPLNSDKEVVCASRKVSFYNGVPVVHTNWERSGTFGIIFLAHRDTTELAHESGHVIQLISLGVSTFLISVAMPSAFNFGGRVGIEYYDAPWEAMADIMGGGYPHNAEQTEAAWKYFILGCFSIPGVWYWG